MTDDIRFDRDMQTLLEQLPEEQLPADRVTPWRQAMRCVLWGIGLTSITLNFWNLQHLLPMVGSILLVLGFRTLRQENGCLRSCWRLSITLAALRGGYAVVMGIVLSRLVPWLETAIAWTLGILFWLVCLGLWWGMREIGRKAGQEKPSAKAAGALVLWYGALILTGLLGQTLQGAALWLLLALYIIILRQLTRLTRALDNCGYAVEAAPVRLDGRWLAGGYLVLVLAAVLLGQALGQRLPMDYRPRQEPSQTAQAVRDRLEGLNLPRELLDDLSDEDVLSLSGVTQTVWMQEPVKKPLSGRTIQFWRAALLTPGDDGPDRWAILTYFRYEGDSCSGDTDGLWLVPHYPYDAYVEEALSGYILYDGPEGAMAAPMQSLVRQEQAQYTDWLWPDIPSSVGLYLFAEWSLPRKGENIRGYLLYWRETVPPMEGDAVHMMDQPYLHRQMIWHYPYATALDQRSIPYATQNFEPGLFSVYQEADGTVSAHLNSAELGSISKRGTPPAT